MSRKQPNILITGTPGVGKTTTAAQLCSQSQDTPYPLTQIAVNEIIKTRQCHESYDSRLQTYVLDEEKLLDEIEKDINNGYDDDDDDQGKKGGGFVIDYHISDIFPERWIDLVVILRCPDTEVFYDRLARGRGYEGEKLQEDIDAEIFGVIAEEAKEGYEEQKVVELNSVEGDDIDANCDRILEWVKTWMENKEKEVADKQEGE